MTESDLRRLRDEGALILETARRTDLGAAVPGLTWDVRTVLIHLGAVHRWSADIVDRSLATNETGGSRAFRSDELARLSGDDLAAWFEAGLDLLVDALRRAPVDLACFTMLHDVSPREFWIRRQAHETAVHRADVQAAGGAPPEVTGDLPTGFAQSGLTELVEGFARLPHFAVDISGAAERTRSPRLLLGATDGPSRLVTFAASGNRVTRADSAESADDTGALGDPDAVVRGTSAQLYLWAWHRPASVEITGDRAVTACWDQISI